MLSHRQLGVQRLLDGTQAQRRPGIARRKLDGSFRLWGQTRDRAKKRRFTGAVAPENDQSVTEPEFEGQTSKDPASTVFLTQPLDLQHFVQYGSRVGLASHD